LPRPELLDYMARERGLLLEVDFDVVLFGSLAP
jgi:hypothetical protein